VNGEDFTQPKKRLEPHLFPHLGEKRGGVGFFKGRGTLGGVGGWGLPVGKYHLSIEISCNRLGRIIQGEEKQLCFLMNGKGFVSSSLFGRGDY